MSLRFELALYDDGDTPVPLGDGAPSPDRNDCTLRFAVDGGPERIADNWSLGELGLVAIELEAAAARLAAGRSAIVRSAVDDADEVPYLLFAPTGERIDVSLFFIADQELRHEYPIDRNPGMAAQLYGWLDAIGGRVLDQVPPELRAMAWGPVGAPRAELIAAMGEAARRGRAAVGIALPAIETALVTAAPFVPRPLQNQPADRPMVRLEKTAIRLGLTPEEADRLALELARMEERHHEPGLRGFDIFDLDAAVARRRAWLETAMPAHEVEVGPFAIDVYPVTNRQWRQYMRDAGAAAPDGGLGREDEFVTGVSWKEAQAYAHHYQLDLPTEAEWEHATRDGRSLFPWGDTYFPQGEVAFRPPVLEPYVVGTRPEIASARGVHDLIGQFGEYCWDPFEPYPGSDLARWREHFPDWRGQRVVRGGYDLNQDATCVSRRAVPPHERRRHLKFRCVRR